MKFGAALLVRIYEEDAAFERLQSIIDDNHWLRLHREQDLSGPARRD